MKVIFSEFSKFELEDAVDYYEFEQQGLGKRFKVSNARAVVSYLAVNEMGYSASEVARA